jgi:hypothetical protein
MQTNMKLTFSSFLTVLLFLIVFILIFTKDIIFNSISESTNRQQVEQSEKANKQIADLLLSLDKITLDTTVLRTPYLQSLVQLPTFPIDAQTISNFGKINPFVGNFIVVPGAVPTQVGGLIFSAQQNAENGNNVTGASVLQARPTTRRR